MGVQGYGTGSGKFRRQTRWNNQCDSLGKSFYAYRSRQERRAGSQKLTKALFSADGKENIAKRNVKILNIFVFSRFIENISHFFLSLRKALDGGGSLEVYAMRYF